MVILLILGMIKVIPIFVSGYNMYKTAIAKTSISEKVSDLRGKNDYVTLNKISVEYQTAVIKSEDRRFYHHGAIDLISTGRAMVTNIFEGSYAEGGSTITQQLAKNLYFSFEKKYERKVAELLVAYDIEKELTKKEILELYCNVAYFGEGCYGIGQASKYYYNTTPDKLSKEQIDALVFTLKSPNNYNPQVINNDAA